LLAAAGLVILAAPFHAIAYQRFEDLRDGAYTFTVTNGQAKITGFDTSYSHPCSISVTNTLGGYPVATIGKEAFLNWTSVTNVTIPDSVTTIGSAAFAHCSSLTSVSIPNSVGNIGRGVFYGCTNLPPSINESLRLRERPPPPSPAP